MLGVVTMQRMLDLRVLMWCLPLEMKLQAQRSMDVVVASFGFRGWC